MADPPPGTRACLEALADPDFVERLRPGPQQDEPRKEWFYSGGVVGYTDYSTLPGPAVIATQSGLPENATSEPKMTQNGSCRCGAVTYRIAQEDLPQTYACHCLDCQSWSGGAFSLNALLLADSLTVEG